MANKPSTPSIRILCEDGDTGWRDPEREVQVVAYHPSQLKMISFGNGAGLPAYPRNNHQENITCVCSHRQTSVERGIWVAYYQRQSSPVFAIALYLSSISLKITTPNQPTCEHSETADVRTQFCQSSRRLQPGSHHHAEEHRQQI